VAVSPLPANDAPGTANLGLVDLRRGSPARAGGHLAEGVDGVTRWHRHDLHQLLYAFTGTIEVETAMARHLLPPQQAAWIPAGLTHRTTLREVVSASVFFAPELVPGSGRRVRVIEARPLLREMIDHAQRWPIDRPASDATADAFFAALAGLCAEWIETELPFHLPVSADPAIARAIERTEADLAGVTLPEAAAAAAMSARSFRRHFQAATGVTWQRYRLQSRVLRAMGLLGRPDHTVARCATEVGFASVSAFSRAFGQVVGESPGRYRRRVGRARVGGR
jgi:AraC-like DNA-binding protein